MASDGHNQPAISITERNQPLISITDDKLIFEFGQFMLHEMTQEKVDRILWMMDIQGLDIIPSYRPLTFMQFAAVHFMTVRFKVLAL